MKDVINTIEKRWDDNAHMYDSTHDTDKNIDLWTAVIKDILGDDVSKSVLDVGTGTGFISLIEAEIGYKTTGLDLSEGMMAFAKQHAAERGVEINFVHSQVEETPFEDNSFDFVTNRSLMWTLLEPVKAAIEWKRIVKTGGKIVSFVHVSTKKSMHNHYDESIESQLNLKGAAESAFVKVFEEAGLVDVKAIQLLQLPSAHGAITTDDNCWYAFVGTKD